MASGTGRALFNVGLCVHAYLHPDVEKHPTAVGPEWCDEREQAAHDFEEYLAWHGISPETVRAAVLADQEPPSEILAAMVLSYYIYEKGWYYWLKAGGACDTWHSRYINKALFSRDPLFGLELVAFNQFQHWPQHRVYPAAPHMLTMPSHLKAG